MKNQELKNALANFKKQQLSVETSAEPIDKYEHLTNALYAIFGIIYPKMWRASYGTIGGVSFDAWKKYLEKHGVTYADIERIADNCVSTGREWPPTMPQFVILVEDSKCPFLTKAVYKQALEEANARRYKIPGSKVSNEIAFHAVGRSGGLAWHYDHEKSDTEDEAFARWKKACIELYESQDSLPALLEHDSEEEIQIASDEVRKNALAQMRAGLGRKSTT